MKKLILILAMVVLMSSSVFAALINDPDNGDVIVDEENGMFWFADLRHLGAQGPTYSGVISYINGLNANPAFNEFASDWHLASQTEMDFLINNYSLDNISSHFGYAKFQQSGGSRKRWYYGRYENVPSSGYHSRWRFIKDYDDSYYNIGFDSVDDTSRTWDTAAWITATFNSYNVTKPAGSGYDLYDSYGNSIVNSTYKKTIIAQIGGDVKVEFEINASINLSEVFVDADSTSTVVANLGEVDGVTGNHTLYVPVVEEIGVYVCPDAETLSEITTSCSGYELFDYATECDGNTAKNVGGDSVICEIVSGNYKLSGLTGSGGGDYDLLEGGSVPEFSTIGMVLAVMIAGIGIVLVVKKRK
ncbi:hypothetical protein GF336_04070 [Candidatus Woesearchaeota archaeon]|nr:hypothetical protein [Candidatus Woesearchaeota archaeon]